MEAPLARGALARALPLRPAGRRPLLRAVVGRDDLALIYVLQVDERDDALVETVDSVDPRYPRAEKSVIIISTQLGCPMGCAMCDAAGDFRGNLDREQLLGQVRFVLERRPEIRAARKLKVHFARMGEPALNPAVLEALAELPRLLPTPGLLPCVATSAPAGARPFLEELAALQARCYPPGQFQMQLSINSTAEATRQRLVPRPLLPLAALAELGPRFHRPGDRRVVLNFALARGCPVEPAALRELFDPAHFMIKLTPVNPTARARQAGLESVLSAASPTAAAALVAALEGAGFETVVSIGEADEIAIGSNCGQAVRAQRA